MIDDGFSLKQGHRSRTVYLIFAYIFLTLLMAIMIIPIVKIVIDSLDPTSAYGLRLWFNQIDTVAYQYIFSNKALYRPFFVSVFTTLLGTFIGLTIVSVTAYVMIQKEMPGQKAIIYFVLFTMIFNGGLIPTFLTIKRVGLMGTFWAVILPLSLNAYNIILMKSFFESIPHSLFESARIDGCSPFGIYWRIVLPLSKPALASIGLFIAVTLWNDFFHFMIYINDPLWQNFQVKLRDLVLSEEGVGAPTTSNMTSEMLKSAVVMVVITPFLIVYPFVQRYFVKGITLGSVKE